MCKLTIRYVKAYFLYKFIGLFIKIKKKIDPENKFDQKLKT